MKNKRLTYILFPLVALIWGYAIYKYLFADHEQGADAPTTIVSTMDTLPAPPVQLDSFNLITDYRDPFLGTAAQAPLKRMEPVAPEHNDGDGQTGAIRAPKIEPPTVAWDSYRYSGLIQHSGTADLVGILRISGKSHYVNVGSLVQGTTVLALTGDSIRLSSAGETKTIGRH